MNVRISCFCWCFVLDSGWGAVPLSQRGRPVAEIVPASLHPAVEYARELQRWVEAFGARLPIVPVAGERPRIVLAVTPGHAEDLLAAGKTGMQCAVRGQR